MIPDSSLFSTFKEWRFTFDSSKVLVIGTQFQRHPYSLNGSYGVLPLTLSHIKLTHFHIHMHHSLIDVISLYLLYNLQVKQKEKVP